MTAQRHVAMGRIAVGRDGEVLEVLGLGSCLAIALYDREIGAGALAHAAFQLEKRAHPLSLHSGDTSYIEVAIDRMIAELEGMGSSRERLEAKLIGAANMFSGGDPSFCEDNIRAAREKLEKEGIRIVGESTGGNRGRSVEFDLATGIVTVRIKF